MLAYTANAPRHVQRPSSPNAMLAIIAGHVALIAVVMSAKMDLPSQIRRAPIVVDFIPEPEAPPPEPATPKATTRVLPSTLDRPKPLVPLPPVDQPALEPTPMPVPAFDPVAQPWVEPRPSLGQAPVRVGAKLITHPAELKPPYPAAKLASGEEAVLRLRLTIDERGRVVAVEPVGPADRAFLDAARRHLLARWRYKPALEDGRAVAASVVITLRFQLEG